MSTIGQLALKSARAYPDKIAVKFKDRAISYADLMERAYALTAYFKSLNLQKGERVGILMSNRLEHIELDVDRKSVV